MRLRRLVSALILCAALPACRDPLAPAVPPVVPTQPSTPSDPPPVANRQVVLPVAPIAQQTPVWCWAAVAEMVLRYYQLPNLNPGGNYQCGVVAVYAGPASVCASDCRRCVAPIGPVSELRRLLEGYGVVARQAGAPSPVLQTVLSFGPLTPAAVVAELDGRRPVVAGISPSGVALPNASQHFAVVVGYVAAGSRLDLVVNDPFPFAAAGQGDPYLALGARPLAPGRYQIGYDTFVGGMRWANTIHAIR